MRASARIYIFVLAAATLWPQVSQGRRLRLANQFKRPELVTLGKRLNSRRQNLRGFVDLHTHPVNHLGYGGKLFHGAPDVGVHMPKNMRGCGWPAGPARTQAEALAPCGGSHASNTAADVGIGALTVMGTMAGGAVAGGVPIVGPIAGALIPSAGAVAGHAAVALQGGQSCGDTIRAAMVRIMESELKAQVSHGAPVDSVFSDNAVRWPAFNDVTHQQMWIDWIERAYKGGLRVMVALAANNQTLARSAKGPGDEIPDDDVGSYTLQLREMRKLFSKYKAWVEIAYNAADIRRIVGSDRLAVVLGIEVDDLGALRAKQIAGRNVSEYEVRKAIRDVYALGARYIIPVHVVDNAFGGTATYVEMFALANRYQAGYWWSLKCKHNTGFRAHLGDMEKMAAAIKLKMDPFEHPMIPWCAPGAGHVNIRGLTWRGRIALDEMMRMGMIIDVDHANHNTVNGMLDVAEKFPGGYPMVSGHSGLFTKGAKENARSRAQYQRIARLGGIAGIGWGKTYAKQWVKNVALVQAALKPDIRFAWADRHARKKKVSFAWANRMAKRSRARAPVLDLPIALGSDINGFVIQPGPPHCKDRADKTTCGKIYDKDFTQSQQGARKWNYEKHGVAHFGMFPDFLRDVSHIGPTSARAEAVKNLPTPRNAASHLRTGLETVAGQTTGYKVVDDLFNGAEGFAKMWERAERSARTAKARGFGRLASTVKEFNSVRIGPFCPTEVMRGDREFDGNGPDFDATVQLRIVNGPEAAKIPRAPAVRVSGSGSALVAKIYFHAKESKGPGDNRPDASETQGTWERVIATAPTGLVFEKILSEQFSEVRGRSSKAGFQFIVATNNGANAGLTPTFGRLVDEFFIVGDTGGDDISDDDNCDDDTSITVTFNPIRVQVKDAAPAKKDFDAVTLSVTNGGDDIRYHSSALVSIVFADGQTREIDVTRLGLGRGQTKSMRIPLGRRVRLGDLRGVKLRHISRKRPGLLTDGVDRWQVASLALDAAGGSILRTTGFELASNARMFPIVANTTDAVRNAFSIFRNTDHRGGDYTSFLSGRADERACAARCQREAKCWAFTWQSSTGRCFLKSRAGPRTASAGNITGAKKNQVLSQSHLGGTRTKVLVTFVDQDHRGGDYTSFLSGRRDAQACAGRCNREARCRAFTWQRSTGRCFLKQRAGPRTPSRGNITGVKTTRTFGVSIKR